MQKEFIKNIYKEFVYCDPNDHLLNPNNTLTRPDKNTSKYMLKSTKLPEKAQITINSETALQKPKLEVRTTGDNTTSKKSEGLKTRNNSEITLVTPTIETVEIQKPPLNTEIKNKHIQKESKQEPVVYDEETFNQIELRGFITKDLLRMSLDKGSNLFHIAEDIFEKLVDRYNQFKEILHTLENEFDNTVECIIETGKELGKKINHIIYQLYLAIMNRRL